MSNIPSFPSIQAINAADLDDGDKLCKKLGLMLWAKWIEEARPEQLEPTSSKPWSTFLLLMGRGAGKTFANINNNLIAALLTPGLKVGCIAPTAAQVKRVLFKEGIMARLRKLDREAYKELSKGWNKNENTLELPNGSTFYGFTSEVADATRGSQFHRLWITELAYCKNQAEIMQETSFTLRLRFDEYGNDIGAPRLVIDTTPERNNLILKKLRDNPKTVVAYGSSLDNKALPAEFIEKMEKLCYTDPELAQQEVFGYLLTDDDSQILDRQFWKMWTKPKYPKPERVIISADTAYKEGKDNDYTAITVWGICPIIAQRKHAIKAADGSEMGTQIVYYRKYVMIMMKAMKRRMEFHAMLTEIQKIYDAEKSRLDLDEDDPSKLLCIVEDKGSGISLIQEMQRGGIPTLPWSTGSKSKMLRAQLAAPILRAGHVYAPSQLGDPEKFEFWVEGVVSQLHDFPAVEHDDYVDSCTQAWNFFRENGYLETQLDRSYRSRDTELNAEEDDADDDVVPMRAAYG